MARLYTADMESQNAATEWQGTINNAPVFDTSIHNTGGVSARFHNTSSQGRQIYKKVYASTDDTARVFLRAYIYVATAPSATTGLMAWSDNIATSPAGFYGIKMKSDRTLIITSSTGTTGTASSAIPLNTWTRIELAYCDVNASTTPSTAKGYINGVSWTTLTGAGLSGGNVARFGIINNATADIYFDDIAVNDTSGGSDNGLPGPVGSTFNESLTNALGTTDSITVIQKFGNSLTDSEGLSDSLSFVSTSNLAFTDLESISDSLSLAQKEVVPLTDAEALTDDFQTVLHKAPIDVSDAEGLADNLSLVQRDVQALAESEGLSDALGFVQHSVSTFSESLGVSEVVSLGQREPENFHDSTGLTDGFSLGFLIEPIGAADSLGLVDAVGSIQKHVEHPSDSQGITEAFSTAIIEREGYSDPVGLTDAFTLFDPNDQPLFEDFSGLTDVAHFPLTQPVTLLEALGTTDNVTVALSQANVLSDGSGLSDFISLILGYWEEPHVPHSSPGYGEIYIDRFFLVEKEKATETTDGKMSLAGQESSPPTTVALVTFLHGQVAGMQEGRLVPVIFRDKAERNAYYSITSASSDLTDFQNEVATADWTIDLTRVGSDAEIDLQSRLTGAVRQNDFALAGQRWHAPAKNAYAYYVGTQGATQITRTGSDGAMAVYVTLPANIHPKWGCAVEDYHTGRVRIMDTLEVSIENEVEGLNRNMSASGWNMTNGLINISPTASAGVLNFASYNGTSFIDKFVNITVGGTASSNNVAAWDSATVIRNDFEQCVIRLTSTSTSGVGRVTLDLGLRRGSRFVEGYLQAGAAAVMSVHARTVDGTTSSTSASGYIGRTTGASNLRWAAGSARTFTSHTNGGVSKTSSLFLDFWWGATTGGTDSAGVTNDGVVALRDQYIGSMPEYTYGVRR